MVPNAGTPKHSSPQSLAGQLAGMAALLRQNRCGPRIFWTVAALVIVIAITAVAQIWLNAWNKPFYNALSQKDVGAFLVQLRVFAELAGVLLVLNVVQLWLDQTLKLTLRRGLFEALLAAWLAPGRAARIGNDQAYGDNPDQRMQIDADNLSELTASLGIGLFQSSLLLFAFVGVLWQQSGLLEFSFGGRNFVIPGFMVWCALFYAAAASGLSWWVGRPLVAMNAERSAREADFRFELVRVNEARDSIALQHGEGVEAARIAVSFGKVVGLISRLIGATANLTWVTAGYGWFTIVAPIIAASPFYFSGSMSFGELMLVVGAFNQVQNSLRWFVANFSAIANWRATLLRVMSFHHALVSLDDMNEVAAPRIARREEGSAIEIDGLRVATPYGSVYTEPALITVAPGERVLLRGSSGSGKTILFRALAGLGGRGEGRIVMPDPSLVHYLPTEAYVPPGRLASAISYPRPYTKRARKDMEAALDAVGLSYLSPRLNSTDRWDRILSGSEKQSIAFARVLLQRREWLVMDDALVHLDPQSRARVVDLLSGELGHVGLLGIGNGTEPVQLYSRIVSILTLPNAAKGKAQPSGNATPREAQAAEPVANLGGGHE